jgi:hypothetical protein
MRFFIYKGERPSEGAVNLKNKIKELGGKCLLLKATGSDFKGGGKDPSGFINWGCTNQESIRLSGYANKLFNIPTKVSIASNKLLAMKSLTEVENLPVPFFTDRQAAIRFLQDTRSRLYARTKLNGSSGEGIVLLMRHDDPQNTRDARNRVDFPTLVVGTDGNILEGNALWPELAICKLFTVGHVGARTEWRAHVAFGKVILVQKKLRARNPDEDAADANTLVRNLSTGWIYSVNFEEDAGDNLVGIKDAALKAVKKLGLHFGAVDLIVDKKTKTPRVLEVNTAPGLEEGSSSLTAYAQAFIDEGTRLDREAMGAALDVAEDLF